jgi:ubiquitin-conjugating enzyme E2 D/E
VVIIQISVHARWDICLDILHDKRSPELSIQTVLLSLCWLLTDPNPKNGLEQEILHVYRRDKTKYEQNARDWTRKYAMENQEK